MTGTWCADCRAFHPFRVDPLQLAETAGTLEPIVAETYPTDELEDAIDIIGAVIRLVVGLLFMAFGLGLVTYGIDGPSRLVGGLGIAAGVWLARR